LFFPSLKASMVPCTPPPQPRSWVTLFFLPSCKGSPLNCFDHGQLQLFGRRRVPPLRFPVDWHGKNPFPPPVPSKNFGWTTGFSYSPTPPSPMPRFLAHHQEYPLSVAGSPGQSFPSETRREVSLFSRSPPFVPAPDPPPIDLSLLLGGGRPSFSSISSTLNLNGNRESF